MFHLQTEADNLWALTPTTAHTLIMWCATTVQNTVPHCDGRQWLHQHTVRHPEQMCLLQSHQTLIRQLLQIPIILARIVKSICIRIYKGRQVENSQTAAGAVHYKTNDPLHHGSVSLHETLSGSKPHVRVVQGIQQGFCTEKFTLLHHLLKLDSLVKLRNNTFNF